MKESIDLLIQLQNLDLGAAKLKKDIETGKREKERLEKEKKEIEAKMLELEQAMKDFDVRLHQKQVDVDEAKSSLEKFREQRNYIKKPRELFALDREIENVIKNIKTFEAEMKKIETDKTQKQDDLNKEQEFLNQKNEEITMVVTKNEETIVNNKSALDEYETKRKDLLERIPSDLLDIYNFLSEKMQGAALSQVLDEACSQCYINLPPQLINEVRRGDKIIRCPSCQRILYVRD